jgi:DNA-3-methyladenine glycosylase II
MPCLGSLSMTVPLPPPLDIDASLALFRRTGDDLIDRWDGTRLVRTIALDGQHVPYVCEAVGSVDKPGFNVEPESLSEVAAKTFFPAPPSWPDLLARDPVLKKLHQRFRGVRQPRQYDLFGALVRCISAQQVNLRWAVTTRRCLAESFGEQHTINDLVVYSLDPRRIADVKPEQIRALQFTTKKAEFIVAVAQAMAHDGLSLSELEKLRDDEVVTRLTQIRGLGRWSAEWILARTLGRPTVVAGDLGVRKAVGLAYLNNPLPTELEVRRATEHWEESAGVAQALLLHALIDGALTGPQPALP